MRPRVVVALTAAGLERERANLVRGSVVAAGVTGLARGADVDVELAFPSGERLVVPGRAVLTTADATIFAFDGADLAALDRHLAASGPQAPPGPAPAVPAEGPEAQAGPALGEAEEHVEAPPHNVQERLRGLTVVEQLKVARDGSLSERVALERLYGKVVWEALLRNTRVTAPEVARMARMGTLPRPLLELIVASPAWLQVPQVRRALLTNPRLSQELLHKVLAALPRDELQQVPQNTAYPAPVRMAAKALLHR